MTKGEKLWKEITKLVYSSWRGSNKEALRRAKIFEKRYNKEKQKSYRFELDFKLAALKFACKYLREELSKN